MEGPWSFEVFWKWLVNHPNCVLRAGTPEVMVFDDEDFHWHFAQSEEEGAYVVQVVRGKRPVAELWVEAEEVSYVQQTAGETQDEFVFELISETDKDRFALYFFVLSHGFVPHGDEVRSRIH
ncbi:MAG: hypothetical protein ACUVRQ_01455 [Thermoanaerobaculaceae bacterium]